MPLSFRTNKTYTREAAVTITITIIVVAVVIIILTGSPCASCMSPYYHVRAGLAPLRCSRHFYKRIKQGKGCICCSSRVPSKQTPVSMDITGASFTCPGNTKAMPTWEMRVTRNSIQRPDRSSQPEGTPQEAVSLHRDTLTCLLKFSSHSALLPSTSPAVLLPWPPQEAQKSHNDDSSST